MPNESTFIGMPVLETRHYTAWVLVRYADVTAEDDGRHEVFVKTFTSREAAEKFVARYTHVVQATIVEHSSAPVYVFPYNTSMAKILVSG